MGGLNWCNQGEARSACANLQVVLKTTVIIDLGDRGQFLLHKQ